MLGIREPGLYGKNDYKGLVKLVKDYAKKNDVKIEAFQSNYEGDIVTKIQKAYKKVDGIIINAGAYTHTSVAILDALKSVAIRTVEVHITDIKSREEFRHVSYVSLYAEKIIVGKGFNGYLEAIDFLKESK